jgi:hypothetical protein
VACKPDLKGVRYRQVCAEIDGQVIKGEAAHGLIIVWQPILRQVEVFFVLNRPLGVAKFSENGMAFIFAHRNGGYDQVGAKRTVSSPT